MGQGVFKDGDSVTFIAKTLPGETGTARVQKRRKGVQFAELEALEQRADNRVEPTCPHYADCPGCHFLHTDYASELNYKLQAFERLLGALPYAKEIEVLQAPQRLAYRNRIQLHYRHKYLGVIDATTDQVREIPQCQIIRDELRPAFESLYEDKSWASEREGSGHCEIYLKPDGVNIEWDQAYAHGGFSQVNEAMNDVLRSRVVDFFIGKDFNAVLDLFSGEGNLTASLVAEEIVGERKMVDFTAIDHEDFLKLDLFDDTALRGFKARCKRKQFDVVIVDPPRKGFPLLSTWSTLR